jgi:hypothetical protein
MPLSTARRSGSNSATICQQVVALSVAPKPSAVDARYRPTHRQCFRRLLNLVNYEVTGVSSEQISDAIVVWSGRGKKGWPLQDDNLVVHEFGNDTAAVLLPIIHRLRDDFYSSDAKDTVADLGLAGRTAAAEFRARHPEITGDAVGALMWCFTYDYK